MDQPIRYTICFDGLEAADAGRAAESLRRSLQEVDPRIKADRVRTDADSMDFGPALAVVLAGAHAFKPGDCDRPGRHHYRPEYQRPRGREPRGKAAGRAWRAVATRSTMRSRTPGSSARANAGDRIRGERVAALP
jgi:hypothetical protein